ncbi:cysteine--tRNA ligase [Candidatus Nomurabacteria bacterium]|nr:cysteine--tRNA ligase [Candidatus Nomurabacteria bacterium]
MIKIYNTETKSKENFSSLKPNSVKIYQCGPTVYWYQHIGNMRAAFIGDIVFRSFIFEKYQVNFVRNFTDVGHLTGDNLGDADQGEDRMEKASKREDLSPQEIAQKYTDAYKKDISLLNILEPTQSPSATEEIYEIKKMVKNLLKKGFAYETDLAIYFDTGKAKNYTRLSGQNIEENLKGSGHGDVEDSQKKKHSDFALWIFKKGKHANALQTWKSPKKSFFEKKPNGFPGWHIECSAMIKRYLGPTIDIHLGGIEHIPTHHTNEIAQSEAANEVDFVKYWMHYEHLLADNKKMAKSEGTGYLLSEIIEKGFDPLTLRFFFLQAHYRSKQNFTWEALEAAQNGLNKLRKDVSSLPDSKVKADKNFINKFKEKLFDDFNTPQALSVVYDILNSNLEDKVKKATILEIDKVLGLDLNKAQKVNIPTEVTSLVNEREEARKSQDWAKSDELREKIESLGFKVKDTANGQEVIN